MTAVALKLNGSAGFFLQLRKPGNLPRVLHSAYICQKGIMPSLSAGVASFSVTATRKATYQKSGGNFAQLEELIAGAGGCVVIDGGLATELERRGADINDPLWSAKCLLDDGLSSMIREVHLDYFRAGAEIVVSASYQATIQGFAARGIGQKEAENLFRKSVELACAARDQFWQEYQDLPSSGTGTNLRQRGLVAASVGSYGAFLADGSEYSGDYGPEVTRETLMNFHRRRLQVLGDSGADLLAIETIPSRQEAEALVQLLQEENLPTPAWISFNSKDGVNVVRGDPMEDCIRLAANCPNVVAVGINCTPPRFIEGLIARARKVTTKPIVVYPNSGEAWDGINKTWVDSTGTPHDDFVSYAPEWRAAGASLLGGCCRTCPDTIRGIRQALLVKPSQ